MSPVHVHVVLLLGQICFASLPVVARLAMRDHAVPAAGIVLVRIAGGAIVFSILAWRRGVLRVARRDLAAMIGCAVIGVGANQELFVQGLARSTATNASVLGATIPVFTALTAIALGRERPSVFRVAGIAIAFAGAATLVLGPHELSMSSEHLVGSAMVLVNSACYGVYLVVVRPLATRYDPLALLAIMFIAAVPMVAPLGIDAWADAPPIGAAEVAFLAFLVAVPTVGAYLLVQTGLRHAESTLVAAYIYLQPVFATLGAIAWLDEQLTATTVVAGAIVLVGVWVAARPRT